MSIGCARSQPVWAMAAKFSAVAVVATLLLLLPLTASTIDTAETRGAPTEPISARVQ